MDNKGDFLITAISNNGKLVGYYSFLKNTAVALQKSHKMNLVSTAVFSRALCAGTLLSGNLKNDGDKLIIMWECTGPAGSILIESNYNGDIRGYIGDQNLDFIETSMKDGNFSTEPYIGFGELKVNRYSSQMKEPYQSVVVIETGEIAEDLSLYMDQSLQVQSAINIGMDISKENQINTLGGIMLMGLPGVTDDEIQMLYSEFEKITSLNKTLLRSKDDVLELFAKLDMKVINTRDIEFSCSCSQEKVLGTLNSFPKDKIEEFVDSDGFYAVKCQYCGTEYRINKDEVGE